MKTGPLILALLILAVSIGPSGRVANAATSTSFTFGAAGDFDGPGGSTLASIGDGLRSAGADLLLALGDLGYTSDEQGWCNDLKSHFNNVIVVAGNHDTTESGPGNITSYVQYCPFTLSSSGVTLVPEAGTPGYGVDYYFDYPGTNPLARFILIVPGIGGELSYDFSTGSPHYTFVANAIDNARSAGIPWVFVGMHKNCLTSGTGHTNCETGFDIQDLFFSKKADVVLNGHEHNYERSRQLTCANASSCIVNPGPSYLKGAGTVIVTQGTGGAGAYSVAQPMSEYYAAAQDSDYGFVKYTVTGSSVSASFVSVSGSYTDSFSISPTGSLPQQTATFPWLYLGVGVVAGVSGAAVLTRMPWRRKRVGLPENGPADTSI